LPDVTARLSLLKAYLKSIEYKITDKKLEAIAKSLEGSIK